MDNAPEDCRRFIFSEQKHASPLRKIKDDQSPDSIIHMLIGPEGGFTNDEFSAACKCGFSEVSLGKRILRTETAAICAVTLMQNYWGDLG